MLFFLTVLCMVKNIDILHPVKEKEEEEAYARGIACKACVALSKATISMVTKWMG